MTDKFDSHSTAELEPDAVHLGGIIGSVLGLFVTIFIICLGSLWLMKGFRNASKRAAAAHPSVLQTAPAPQLQTNEHEDLVRYTKSVDQELNRYDWTDRNRGIARVPIARAMELYLANKGERR